jgi:hypothetical protein
LGLVLSFLGTVFIFIGGAPAFVGLREFYVGTEDYLRKSENSQIRAKIKKVDRARVWLIWGIGIVAAGFLLQFFGWLVSTPEMTIHVLHITLWAAALFGLLVSTSGSVLLFMGTPGDKSPVWTVSRNLLQG